MLSVALASDGSPPVYEVFYKPNGNQKDVESKEYDIVIFATPLYKGMIDVNFDDFQNPISPVNHDFHLTVASFMEGSPDPKYFNVDSIDDLPNAIFCLNTSEFMNSLSKQKPVANGNADKDVYRIFSNKVPNVDQLKQVVPEWSDLRVVSWQAYPEYPSTMRSLPSFTLHEQMYHINAIEMAASAMEMSALSAKNVALLAFYRYTGQYDKIDEILTSESSSEKSEL